MACFKLLDDCERKRLKKGDMICQDDFVDMFLDNIGAFFYADESRTRRIYIEIMGREDKIYILSRYTYNHDR